MIMVFTQWQSEIMTILQGDFEEELRRMSVNRAFDHPTLRDRPKPDGSPKLARRYEIELDA
jgi:hypothetical protein